MKRLGFTLIELLVVIAIIAILAAILFPVFAQVKFAAKKAASLSNVKQIDLAALMYAGDYDDNFVLSINGLASNIQNYPGGHIPARTDTWVTLLHPNIKSYGIYVDAERGDSPGFFSGPPCVPTSPTDTQCIDHNSYVNQNLFAYFGMNYGSLAPFLCTAVGCPDYEGASVATTSVTSPSSTLSFINSELIDEVPTYGTSFVSNPDFATTYGGQILAWDGGTFRPICNSNPTLCNNSATGGNATVTSGTHPGDMVFFHLTLVSWLDGHASSIQESKLLTSQYYGQYVNLSF
jgi:prepilin-type N-terminal cleavage/methylation domain-containing protein